MMTLLRIVLSCILNIYLYNKFSSIKIPIVITTLIYFTDFFDGKIARVVGSASRFGAILDVIADLFYIIISYMVLYKFHVLPLWFLFIILFNFIEFIITSFWLKKASSSGSVFVFDLIGRYAATFFYAIPMFSYVSFMFYRNISFVVINIFMCFITFMVVISSIYRISNILWRLKNEKLYIRNF